MPASTGDSVCSTLRPILPRPSARSVPRWRSLWPILLRICVILTLATLRILLLAEAAALRLFLGGWLGRHLGLGRSGGSLGLRSGHLGDRRLDDGLLLDGRCLDSDRLL